MESEKKPKKRGRKPKNTIISKTKEQKEKVEIPENLIIRLKKSDTEADTITAFQPDEYSKVEESRHVSEVCWNCCHPFNGITIHGIPLKYVNNIFYIYGDFCSLECASRYAFESLRNYDFSEIYSLMNLYNNIMFQKIDKIELAPNRLLLKKFGGNQTIEEYRSFFKNQNVYDIKLPPILPINHNMDIYETNQNISKSNLKLYRKKPLPSEKKSITSSMNLIIESGEVDL